MLEPQWKDGKVSEAMKVIGRKLSYKSHDTQTKEVIKRPFPNNREARWQQQQGSTILLLWVVTQSEHVDRNQHTALDTIRR